MTSTNWTVLAMRAYDNPSCTGIDEFQSDMRHFKYVRKLITHYKKTGELKERLVLNHVILLSNVLGPQLTVRILFLKMSDYLSSLAPFLLFLNILPDVVVAVGDDGRDFRTDEIGLDPIVVSALRRMPR